MTKVASTESTTESKGDTIAVCGDCGKHPCECPAFVCPYHGRVKAAKSGNVFKCSVKDCTIQRKKSELEFP